MLFLCCFCLNGLQCCFPPAFKEIRVSIEKFAGYDIGVTTVVLENYCLISSDCASKNYAQFYPELDEPFSSGVLHNKFYFRSNASVGISNVGKIFRFTCSESDSELDEISSLTSSTLFDWCLCFHGLQSARWHV